MRILTAIAIFAYSALMIGGEAFAQPQPQALTTITVKEVATLLQVAGYRASVVTQTDGSKYVKIAMSNNNVTVFLDGCDKDNCSVLYFFGSWERGPMTPDLINQYNEHWFYVKAYFAPNGNVCLRLDVNMQGGITADNIKANAVMYEGQLGEFIKVYFQASKK